MRARSLNSLPATRSLAAGCLIAAIVILALASACSDQQHLPTLDPELRAKLEHWLLIHGEDPTDYVLELFEDHDVVFLGEWHRVRHDILLVRSLLEPLHAAGVRTMATEFARREDQNLIDSLLAGQEWNEELARRIVFQQSVFWGYQEYVDILEAAWQINVNLPIGASPFRVLAMNDSPDWSFIESEEDRQRPEVMRKVWQGGGEKFWAEVILNAVGSGERVLVHCGIHHAFTEYRQPSVDGKGNFVRFDPNLRTGNHVYQAIGKRTLTVFLHSPWRGSSGYGSPLGAPADGIIDALMLGMRQGPSPVGFNLSGSPFGALPIENAVYRHGYDDFTLGVFCDGWIYTKPFSEYAGVTPIDGWIHEGNLEYARLQSPNPKYRNAGIDKFMRALARAADMPRRVGHLSGRRP